MNAPSMGRLGRLLFRLMSFSAWLSRRRALELLQSLNSAQRVELLERIKKAQNKLVLSRMPDDIAKLLFSPQAMLVHPLLIHYIRPAIRMASARGYDASEIPIITNPELTFGGQAVPLASSSLKIAEIPLGLVFLLRELGRGIVNLHNAIQYKESEKVRLFAKACVQLSALIYEPAPVAFSMGEHLFKKIPFSYKLYAAQASHVLGVFLILHEAGHICRNHNLDPWSDEQIEKIPDQEHQADIFAMECLLSIKKDNPKFQVFRDIEMIYVCDLLSLMEIEFEASGQSLNGYPSFKDRRVTLLSQFESTDDVRNAVILFEQELRRAQKALPFNPLSTGKH
jgi:hypothetical protein